MEEEKYNDIQQRMAENDLQNSQMNQIQQSMAFEEQNRGTIKEQLDLSDELEKIDHLLRGHIEKRNQHGEKVWVKPPNNDDILLSEAGINLVLNTIQWYINKNTLLSNYDADTIKQKMEDFSMELADTLFMNYQRYFLYPSEQECQDKLIDRLKKKQQEQVYSAQLRGREIDAEQVWRDLVDEIDPVLERHKIKEQMIKDKLKLYALLMRQIQDAVHSTYNRAFMGQERKTLRQHIHVSETHNPVPERTKSSGIFNSYRER